MFVSKKEFNKLKDAVNKLGDNHDKLVELVLKQEEEIRKLKEAKAPTYMA